MFILEGAETSEQMKKIVKLWRDKEIDMNTLVDLWREIKNKKFQKPTTDERIKMTKNLYTYISHMLSNGAKPHYVKNASRSY